MSLSQVPKEKKSDSPSGAINGVASNSQVLNIDPRLTGVSQGWSLVVLVVT